MERLDRAALILALCSAAGCAPAPGGESGPSSTPMPVQAPAEGATPVPAGPRAVTGWAPMMRAELRVLEDGQLQRRVQHGPWLDTGMDHAVSVAGNRRLGCVLFDHGRLKCWSAGHEDDGWEPSLRGVRSLAAQDRDLCALTDEEIVCFDGGTDERSRAHATAVARAKRRGKAPPPVHPPGHIVDRAPTEGAVALATVRGEKLAILTKDGALQQGLGRAAWEEIEGALEVVEAQLGGSEAVCARLESGEVWCRVFGPGRTFEPLPELRGVVDLLPLRSWSGRSVCALTEQGQVWCWGDNVLGQAGLGEGAPQSVERPSRVDIGGVVRLLGAQTLACAETADGARQCWGDSTQLVPREPAMAPVIARLLPIEPADDLWTDGARLCVRRGDSAECTPRRPSGAMVAAERWPPLPLDPYERELQQEEDRDEGRAAFRPSGDRKVRPVDCEQGLCWWEGLVTLPAPPVQVERIHDGACARMEDGRVACWGGLPPAMVGETAPLWLAPTKVPR